MQTKTGAFLSMGRIPQFIGHAAVAAGLLAGGTSLLNAGGAMANPFPPAPCPQGPVGLDPVIITCDPPPSAGTGDVLLTGFTLAGKKTYQVDTDFEGPPAGGGFLGGPYSGKFEYTIKSLGHPFNFVGLSQNVLAGLSVGAEVTKAVYGVPDVGAPILLTTLGAGLKDTFDVGQPIDPLYKTLFIVDTYSGHHRLPGFILQNSPTPHKKAPAEAGAGKRASISSGLDWLKRCGRP